MDLESNTKYDIEIEHSDTNEVILEWQSDDVSTLTTRGVVAKKYLYSLQRSREFVTAEKIAKGTDELSNPRNITAYEYLSGYSGTGILTKVIRSAEENDTGAISEDEVTVYEYPEGFHSGTPIYAKEKVTKIKVNATTDLVSRETYDSDGKVVFSKDANGMVTYYQYYSDSTNGGIEDRIQYEVRDIDTDTLPSGITLPADFSTNSMYDSYETTTGLNLVTEYQYDYDSGDTTLVVHPDGSETHYVTKTASSSYSYTWNGDEFSYADTEEHWTYNIVKSGSDYILTKPVSRTISIKGGATLSTQQITISGWAIDATGHTSAPSASDAVDKILTRRDSLYDASGNMVASWSYTDNTSGSEIYLETEYAYYDDGRTKYVKDPSGLMTYYTERWYEYETDKYVKESRVYPVTLDSTYTLEGPVQVTWTDAQGRTVRTWTGTHTGTSEPSGSETLTELSRTVYEYDWRDRTDEIWQYHDVPSTLTATGSETTNYYKIDYLAYDNQGRPLRVKDAAGNISATVYDDSGRAVKQYVGTSDTGATRTDPSAGASNLAFVSQTYYDTDKDGTGTPTDYATRTMSLKPGLTTLAGTTADLTYVDYSAPYATDATSGDQIRWSKPENGTWSQEVSDDSGRVTESLVYKNGTTDLLAQTTYTYNTKGQLTSQKVYGVTSGTAGNYLETTYDYDDLGRQIRVTQPAGGMIKTVYDAAGRVTAKYVVSDEGTTDDPATLTDDIVVEQTSYSYDDDTGRLWLTTTYKRHHDDTTTTGAFISTSSAQKNYVVTWYDAAGRPTSVVNYGDNGGTAITAQTEDLDPQQAGTQDYDDGAPAPNTSEYYIVSKYEYDSAGRLEKQTDNSGIVTKYFYDALGRKLYMAENFDDFTSSGTLSGDATDNTKDRVTKYVYNAASQITQQIALDPNGDGTTTDQQVTVYTYGGGSCPVSRNDLLVKTKYPDGDDTDDNVKMTYYADGRVEKRTDQRGVEHTYEYDDLGRLKLDKITNFGDLDDDSTADENDIAIRRVASIKREYDDLGRLETVTSYSVAANPADDDRRSIVSYTYNGLGQQLTETQEHFYYDDDATPPDWASYSNTITKTYDTTVSGTKLTKASRQNTLQYPNGHKIHIDYGTAGISDVFSRIESIKEDDGGSAGNSVVDYSFNGLNRMVTKDLPLPDIKLDYSASSYGGFDRFGRVVNQKWTDYGASSDVFDIDYTYDRASNRTVSDRGVYAGYSQVYDYDNLHRLTNYKSGKLNSAGTDVESYWQNREQDYTLDAVGNQTSVGDFDQTTYYTGTFNEANEFDPDTDPNRKIRGDYRSEHYVDVFDDSNTASNFTKPGSGDAFDIDTSASSSLKFTTVSQDTIESQQEEEARAFVVTGQDISTGHIICYLTFPSQTSSGYAGAVFGYKSANDYWMKVLDIGAQKEQLYHVEDGVKTLKTSYSRTISAGSATYIYCYLRSDGTDRPSYDFVDGCPSGKIGLVTNVSGTTFESMRLKDESVGHDLAGRWACHKTDTIISLNKLYLNGYGDGAGADIIKNLRLDKFQADFSVVRRHSTTANLRFLFNVVDQHHYNVIKLYHDSAGVAPLGYDGVSNGYETSQSYTTRDATKVPARASASDVLWYRVQNDGTNISVYAATTKAGLDSAEACFVSSAANYPGDGGYIGFNQGYVDVDDLTVRSWDGSAWQDESFDNFNETSNFVEEKLLHDDAGNLTYDGTHTYAYDAWGRMVRVKRAYRNSAGTLTEPVTIAKIHYDGMGRRIVKAIENSEDWNEISYHYYYDGQRCIEERNGSDLAIKQYVWGTQYVDELVQIRINPIVGANKCSYTFYPMHDANYNILGVASNGGRLIERYEYTPYGQRTVFSHAWLVGDCDGDGNVDANDLATINANYGTGTDAGTGDIDCDGDVDADDQATWGANYGSTVASSDDPLVTHARLESYRINNIPYGLCDIGHQGLMYDKEFGLYDNDARYLHPGLGRFMQRDPSGYPDGMNAYESRRSNPVKYADPVGATSISFIAHYFFGGGKTYNISYQRMRSLMEDVSSQMETKKREWANKAKFEALKHITCEKTVYNYLNYIFEEDAVNFRAGTGPRHPGSDNYVLSNSDFFTRLDCEVKAKCGCDSSGKKAPICFRVLCGAEITIKDRFANPLDIKDPKYEFDQKEYDKCVAHCNDSTVRSECIKNCRKKWPQSELPGGTPYDIRGFYETNFIFYLPGRNSRPCDQKKWFSL